MWKKPNWVIATPEEARGDGAERPEDVGDRRGRPDREGEEDRDDELQPDAPF